MYYISLTLPTWWCRIKMNYYGPENLRFSDASWSTVLKMNKQKQQAKPKIPSHNKEETRMR